VVGRPLRRPKSRREDNITMGIKKVRWQAVDWINLPQDREKGRDVVSRVTNFWVQQCEPNFLAT